MIPAELREVSAETLQAGTAFRLELTPRAAVLQDRAAFSFCWHTRCIKASRLGFVTNSNTREEY